MRATITLACTACKERNYMTTKGKKKQERVEYKKFCPSCGKHTMHKEVK